MSRVSVFKFNIINDVQNTNDINNLINNYLASRGFSYNEEYNCYMTGVQSNVDDKSNAILSVGMSAAATIATGGVSTVVFNSIQRGMEYKFCNGQLIIKAFLINKGCKSYIHSTFNNSNDAALYYGDLRGSLFKNLKKLNAQLESKDIEVINDGKEPKVAKILLIYVLVMFALAGGIIFFFFGR